MEKREPYIDDNFTASDLLCSVEYCLKGICSDENNVSLGAFRGCQDILY